MRFNERSVVFLAITPSGLRQAIALSEVSRFAIWCGANAISQSEYAALHDSDVTRFTYALDRESPEVVRRAIETIAEHHPDATIWIEHCAAP